MPIRVQILKYAEIVWNSRTMILSIKMSTINLWTVVNPDEFIFPYAVTYGRKHSPPKEAESVEYFSQLSATNENCSIFYWRHILKIQFSNTDEAYINNGLSWLIKVLRKGCLHNGPVMCPQSVIMALEVSVLSLGVALGQYRRLGPLLQTLDT